MTRISKTPPALLIAIIFVIVKKLNKIKSNGQKFYLELVLPFLRASKAKNIRKRKKLGSLLEFEVVEDTVVEVELVSIVVEPTSVVVVVLVLAAVVVSVEDVVVVSAVVVPRLVSDVVEVVVESDVVDEDVDVESDDDEVEDDVDVVAIVELVVIANLNINKVLRIEKCYLRKSK